MEMDDVISLLIKEKSFISSLDLSTLNEEDILEIYLNHLKIKAKDGELFKLLPIHKAANGDLISINENTFLGHTSNTLPNEMRAEIKFLQFKQTKT